MTSLLVEQGAPVGAALIATSPCRLATLWFALPLDNGAISSIGIRHRIECILSLS